MEGPGLAAPARGPASVVPGREGCGPACGRASTYAVVGQQRIRVVLGEKGGGECPELPRCPPAAAGTQPCRAAGHGPACTALGRPWLLRAEAGAAEGDWVQWQGPRLALVGMAREHLQRAARDPRWRQAGLQAGAGSTQRATIPQTAIPSPRPHVHPSWAQGRSPLPPAAPACPLPGAVPMWGEHGVAGRGWPQLLRPRQEPFLRPMRPTVPRPGCRSRSARPSPAGVGRDKAPRGREAS